MVAVIIYLHSTASFFCAEGMKGNCTVSMAALNAGTFLSFAKYAHEPKTFFTNIFNIFNWLHSIVILPYFQLGK